MSWRANLKKLSKRGELQYLTRDISKTIDDEAYRQLTQIQKDKLSKLHQDSEAYALVGRKCFFCGIALERKDVQPPRQAYESKVGVSHGDCLKYVREKYPNRNVLDFENKVVRMRVEGL